MSDDAKEYIPPGRNGNGGGFSDMQKFLALITQMVVEGGIGWNAQCPIQAPDDQGIVRNTVTTPAQLMTDLILSMREQTDLIEHQNELAMCSLELQGVEFDEDGSPIMDEEPPPRKKKRR